MAIISEAASSGISLHADRRAKVRCLFCFVKYVRLNIYFKRRNKYLFAHGHNLFTTSFFNKECHLKVVFTLHCEVMINKNHIGKGLKNVIES